MSQIILPPILDLAAAAALKQELMTAFAPDSDAVVIDAKQVQRVGSPCLQILVAAVRRGASIANASSAFGDTATLLGLGEILKLESAHV